MTIRRPSSCVSHYYTDVDLRDVPYLDGKSLLILQARLICQ
ncbi:predicted protein [Botrytis cinerea T4]|uniref:Uncharacterized protein n=1 Tax=Botryotinia fuckeliana (strain T4) TaxID=999810 RepID=G2YIR6_BOTF4|nr:predicted protein [Botrytis cinerea T4]